MSTSRRPDGILKVGYSNAPADRIRSIGYERGERLKLVHVSSVLPDAGDIEARAHWLLREDHLGSEWFSCTTATAIAAIALARQDAGRGEPTPQRINNATPYADLKDVRIQLVIGQSEIDALDEWRAQNKIWSRSDAIRQAIQLLISQDRKPAVPEEPGV